MLSDEWLPRYGLKQNLKVGDGNANANADAKVTTIALPVLCTGELKMKALEWTQHFPHYNPMGAICCHGNQSSNPTWSKI